MTLVGRTLDARFDILGLLGRGGMGAVYRAYDRELDDVVALKVIAADEDTRAEVALERFRREVKLARRVTHPNVARTFELVRAGGITCCTMELIDGESLRRWLARGALPLAQAIAVTRTLCNALAAAHAVGVIHRDVKPENILVAHDGRVVLADFGIAALEENSVGGTPPYMAPEQALGAPPSPALDVYAVGVVLYEMLTGARAFRGTAEEIAAAKQAMEHLELPGGDEDRVALARVVARATARDVERRFATCDALAAALAPWPARELAAPRIELPSASVRTLCVSPPVEDEGARVPLHLANAVYEGLLARLVTLPRLRVTSSTARRDATYHAALHTSDALALVVAGPGSEVTVALPADAGDLALAVDVAYAAIVAIVDHRPPAHATSREASELALRARALTHRNTLPSDAAVALLERANALAPDDPQIAATFAMAEVRRAFHQWGSPDERVRLDRASELVGVALALAPGSGEAHLAAGLVEISTGDTVIAARQLRRALACAPQLAEARELLGRLLLEAGYLTDGMRQVELGLANAPAISGTQWEVARTYALDGRWNEYDRLAATLVAAGSDRPVQRMRAELWRGHPERVAAIAPHVVEFDPRLLDALLAVEIAGGWAARRDAVVAHLRASDYGPRRRTFLLQIAIELAAHARDQTTGLALLADATACGLFDLLWLDRCPLLEPLRAHAAFAPHRARVAGRANAIFDALYGDLTSATEIDVVPSGIPTAR